MEMDRLRTSPPYREHFALYWFLSQFSGSYKNSIVHEKDVSIRARKEIDAIFILLELYCKQVSRTYLYPSFSVDGKDAVNEFNYQDGTTHMARLERMAKDFTMECNTLCKRNETARKELYTQNLQWQLQLYSYSIPALCHVRHFNELVLECANPPPKKTHGQIELPKRPYSGH